jgi:hypothetical protein
MAKYAMKYRSCILAATAAVSLAMAPCRAESRIFVGSCDDCGAGGTPLKARAEFELYPRPDALPTDPQQYGLRVKLSNTSMTDVLQNPDVLTAVFFDIAGTPNLVKDSAKLADGSTVLHGSAGPGGNVGGEWGYKRNTSGLGSGVTQKYGISAVGFGIFSASNRFDTTQNLFDPPSGSLNGIDYGLTSSVDDPTTGSGHVSGSQAWPLIKNGVVLQFTGLPTTFKLSDITNIRFQYGSSLTAPCLTGSLVPEPGTLALLGLGVAPIVARCRRRRQPAGSIESPDQHHNQ